MVTWPEVEVGTDEGLEHESAVNCDNLFTLPEAVLSRRLGPARLGQFDQALAIALGLS
jgi:mRNA-degrading endonuclease toxin of MazEF toxin-antitoxin module